MKIVTLIRLDNGQPFVTRATMITNPADGSVSFQNLDNNNLFIGQTPSDGQPWASVYGVRYTEPGATTPDSAVCGAYQRATLDAGRVTFQTRPQDIPCVYLLGQGQTY